MNPLDKPCPKCKAPAGQKCKNYLGKGKQPCPARCGKLPKDAPRGQASKRDPLGDLFFDQQS